MSRRCCRPTRSTSGVTEHPAVAIKSLQEGHDLGKDGLAGIFQVGSLWHYGPTYENMETVVRIIEAPQQSSGPKPLRDNNLAKWRTLGNGRRESVRQGPRTWFVKCEVVRSPYHSPGAPVRLPPCALIPAAAVAWERGVFGLQPGEAPTAVELHAIREEAWQPDAWTAPYCRADIDFCVAALEIVEAENARLRSENGSLKSQVTKANKTRDDAKAALCALRTRLDEAMRASYR